MNIIFEGTLKEILAQSPDLLDRRVRVTVLEAQPVTSEAPRRMSVAESLGSKIGMLDGGSPDLSQNTGEAFTDLIAQKHQS